MPTPASPRQMSRSDTESSGCRAGACSLLLADAVTALQDVALFNSKQHHGVLQNAGHLKTSSQTGENFRARATFSTLVAELM